MTKDHNDEEGSKKRVYTKLAGLNVGANSSLARFSNNIATNRIITIPPVNESFAKAISNTTKSMAFSLNTSQLAKNIFPESYFSEIQKSLARSMEGLKKLSEWYEQHLIFIQQFSIKYEWPISHFMESYQSELYHELKELFDNNAGIDEIEKAFCDYYSPDSQSLTIIEAYLYDEEFWGKERVITFKQVLKAYRSEDYSIGVYALFPHFEGVIHDMAIEDFKYSLKGTRLSLSKSVSYILEEVKADKSYTPSSVNLFENIIQEVIERKIYGRFDAQKYTKANRVYQKQLRRSTALHGVDPDNDYPHPVVKLMMTLVTFQEVMSQFKK